MNKNKNKSLEKDMSSQTARLNSSGLLNVSGGGGSTLGSNGKLCKGCGKPIKPWQPMGFVPKGTTKCEDCYKRDRAELRRKRNGTHV